LSGETDRDQSVDRVLRRTRASRSASDAGISDGCLDAETLAAWADGELPSNERAAAEQHAADCARCQAMLAAMVRTTPEAAPAPPRWRLSGFGWLVPLAATAAAVGIWIAVPERPARPPESAPRPADAVSPSPALPAPPASPAPTPRAQPDTAELRARDSRADARAKQIAPPPAAAAAPPPAQAFREEAAPAVQPSASAPSRAFERTTANSLAETIVVSAVVDIVSPDPMSRWRIAGGRSVERSTDGGATWQPQQAGATSDLVAGSSPSPTVCWLVGRAGLVLLTIDGRQWRRVVFPVPADLSTVSAGDASTAVVTTSDGRTFRTSDAGRTWAR
jgi:hypothetical protein